MTSQPTPTPAKPLDDLTVIDFTNALAGPFATLLLGGLGATVIKVENPDGGDPARSQPPYLGPDGTRMVREQDDHVSLSFIVRCRNKRGVTLNLKHPEAGALAERLLAHADIVVENYSPGTADRLGIGYDTARRLNPAVVYCSISGFGADGGPDRSRAYDTIAQALSGIMLTSGDVDAPPARLGIPMGDLVAPLFGVIGILAAVHHARRTGQGQHVDVSMVGALSAIVAQEPFDALERHGIPSRTGNAFPRLGAFGVFPARDGHVAICAPTDRMAHALFEVIDRPELVDDPRFRGRDGRVVNYRALHDVIGEWTGRHPTGRVVQAMQAAGVPVAEVRGPAAAARDPETVRRGETVPLAHPRHGIVDDVMGFGMPLRFSTLAADLDQPAPELGEHNEGTYGSLLGIAPDELRRLRGRGVL